MTPKQRAEFIGTIEAHLRISDRLLKSANDLLTEAEARRKKANALLSTAAVLAKAYARKR